MTSVRANQYQWMICGLAVAAIAILYFFDPATSSFYPSCPFFRVTRWRCPGCGSTRALHALLHGELRLAFSHNPWFPLTVLVAGLAVVRQTGWFRHKPR